MILLPIISVFAYEDLYVLDVHYDLNKNQSNDKLTVYASLYLNGNPFFENTSVKIVSFSPLVNYSINNISMVSFSNGTFYHTFDLDLSTKNYSSNIGIVAYVDDMEVVSFSLTVEFNNLNPLSDDLPLSICSSSNIIPNETIEIFTFIPKSISEDPLEFRTFHSYSGFGSNNPTPRPPSWNVHIGDGLYKSTIHIPDNLIFPPIDNHHYYPSIHVRIGDPPNDEWPLNRPNSMSIIIGGLHLYTSTSFENDSLIIKCLVTDSDYKPVQGATFTNYIRYGITNESNIDLGNPILSPTDENGFSSNIIPLPYLFDEITYVSGSIKTKLDNRYAYSGFFNILPYQGNNETTFNVIPSKNFVRDEWHISSQNIIQYELYFDGSPLKNSFVTVFIRNSIRNSNIQNISTNENGLINLSLVPFLSDNTNINIEFHYFDGDKWYIDNDVIVPIKEDVFINPDLPVSVKTQIYDNYRQIDLEISLSKDFLLASLDVSLVYDHIFAPLIHDSPSSPLSKRKYSLSYIDESGSGVDKLNLRLFADNSFNVIYVCCDLKYVDNTGKINYVVLLIPNESLLSNSSSKNLIDSKSSSIIGFDVFSLIIIFIGLLFGGIFFQRERKKRFY